MYKTVGDIPEDYVLVQTDHEVQSVLEYIGVTENYPYVFVKLDESGADYLHVYGCYRLYLGAPVYQEL